MRHPSVIRRSKQERRAKRIRSRAVDPVKAARREARLIDRRGKQAEPVARIRYFGFHGRCVVTKDGLIERVIDLQQRGRKRKTYGLMKPPLKITESLVARERALTAWNRSK